MQASQPACISRRQDARSTTQARCLCYQLGIVAARQPMLTSPAFRPPHVHAKNSSDGLRRQAAAGLPVYRPALASVAIPIATSAFQCAPPTSAEFCALDSRLRHCSSRDVADSNRDCDLGATATRRIIELDSPSDVGRRDRDVPFNGLRLLVVALGHAHGAVLLAISQRASHRPGSRCEHAPRDFTSAK